MPWLWYVAPVALIIVYYLTGLPGARERERDAELARWRDRMTPKRVVKTREGYRGTKESKTELEGPRMVSSLPGDLQRLIPDLGGGQAIAYYELQHKLAYVAIMGPDALNGSEYQAVLMKLQKRGPNFRVRPLPIVEGKRIPNTGVQFKKDATFMTQFLVEGTDGRAIGKWLPRSLRKIIREEEDAWLTVDGRAMALVHYGRVEADRLYDLIAAADALFADRGAEGGPSLFFDDEEDEPAEADAGDAGEGEGDKDAPAPAPPERSAGKRA